MMTEDPCLMEFQAHGCELFAEHGENKCEFCEEVTKNQCISRDETKYCILFIEDNE